MKQLNLDNIQNAQNDREKLEDGSSLLMRDMETVMQTSMLPYAEHVIMDRAIPRVEDGLKPVQRRILYAMYELGITPDKPYKKSARIVGDCLGKYHPHGDSSVYNAMVRMAQPFSMRCPLVEGQGNFGSVDGDSAAAMRYTEARLSELAMEMLKDIDKNTVRWSRNFDDTTKEPDMLPGRFPNLLVNGASGIAVGLATNIPPHNLAEVINGIIAYIDNKNIKLSQLMKYITGPDFPTGGYCIGSEGLLSAYETGRGKITVRARCQIVPSDNGKEEIIITELPYQVNKSELLKEIVKLKETKKEQLAGIAEIVDESDKEGMRAVIKIRKDYSHKQILPILYKYTNMQVSFGINMVAIADGKPQQMGLLDIIACYTNYQKSVVLARSKFELEEAKERVHVVEGLVIAVRNIDEVIQIIRSAAHTTEAKQKLRLRFELSEVQAQAILDLRLARLTKLEIDKLLKELEALRALIARLEEIVRNNKVLMEVVKEELTAIKKAYKSERLTRILDKEEDAVVEVISDELPVENTVICLTAAGKIKRVSSRNFAMSSKEADKAGASAVSAQLMQTVTNKKIIFFTSAGNCYRTEAGRIKEIKYREEALTLQEIFKLEEDEKAVAVFELPEEGMPQGEVLTFTQNGMVKRTAWEEYGLLKSAFCGYKGKEGDNVIKVEPLINGAPVVYISKKGMCVKFSSDEIPLQGRVAGGVKGMLLDDDDYVVFAGQVPEKGEVAILTDKSFAKKIKCEEIGIMARYRKGVKAVDLTAATGGSVIAAHYSEKPYAMLTEDAACVVVLSADDFAAESRTGKGKLPKSRKKAAKLIYAVPFKTEL